MDVSRIVIGAVAAMAAFSAPAQAAVLFDLSEPTVRTEVPGFLEQTFDAGGGAGEIDFVLRGFNTLDGFGVVRSSDGASFEDDFTLSLNGTAILSGTWNLGGGGGSMVFFAPPGATAVVAPPGGIGSGGFVTLHVPLGLAAGLNTLRFAFDTATPQPFDDENWRIEGARVTGAAAGVPEPSTWALMLLAFGGAGAALRARRGPGCNIAQR